MSKYDAVIIGGGVIGSCIAYYLSKCDLQVALIEKGDIASGTSSGCDGNVLIADKKPGYDTKLAYISQNLLQELKEEIEYDFDYSQRGSIYIIESSEEWKVAEKYVKQQAQDGYPMRMMDKKEVHEDEPYLADDIIGGVEIDCDASLNPMTFAFGLISQAQKNSLEVYDHTIVKDIELDGRGNISKVVTDSIDFNTGIVINAAGVWAPEIGKMVDIDVPIKPRQGQLLVAEKTFKVGKRKIVEFGYMMAKFGDEDYKRDVDSVIENNGIAFVFEPTLADNFLIGSSRSFKGFDTSVSIEVMQGLARRALRFFPIMKDINVIRAYAGLRPYVPDHFPIVSEVKTIPGFYIAAGHEGDGIGLGPVTGKLISQMVMGEDLLLPVDKLSYTRFLN